LTNIKTDILIIGGGIAGCIAAISLVDSFKVTLIDKLPEPKEKIGESLAPAAGRILRELNLLDELETKEGIVYLKNLGMQSYWGSDRVNIVDHMRNPDGFVKSLDRKAFESFLRKSVEERGINCMWGNKLYNSSYETAWKVKAKSNGTNSGSIDISATYVIDASGRQSHFARSLGIKREVEDKLIACWMSLPNTKENTMSIISSSENGWWYSAVVPNNRRVIAFHTDSDLIAKNELKDTESLLKLAQQNREISELIDADVDSIQFHGTVAANSTRLEQVAGSGWAAIGDAATSFDPLSSQGMFNAMATAMQLSALIKKVQFTGVLEKVYSKQMDRIWQHYRRHKRTFYGAEARWRNSEFWKRRHHDL